MRIPRRQPRPAGALLEHAVVVSDLVGPEERRCITDEFSPTHDFTLARVDSGPGCLAERAVTVATAGRPATVSGWADGGSVVSLTGRATPFDGSGLIKVFAEPESALLLRLAGQEGTVTFREGPRRSRLAGPLLHYAIEVAGTSWCAWFTGRGFEGEEFALTRGAEPAGEPVAYVVPHLVEGDRAERLVPGLPDNSHVLSFRDDATLAEVVLLETLWLGTFTTDLQLIGARASYVLTRHVLPQNAEAGGD